MRQKSKDFFFFFAVQLNLIKTRNNYASLMKLETFSKFDFDVEK